MLTDKRVVYSKEVIISGEALVSRFLVHSGMQKSTMNKVF